MAKRQSNPVPLGSVTLMNDDEIDEFPGTVSQADVELLRAQWKKYASVRYVALVDTRQIEPIPLGNDGPTT